MTEQLSYDLTERADLLELMVELWRFQELAVLVQNVEPFAVRIVDVSHVVELSYEEGCLLFDAISRAELGGLTSVPIYPSWDAMVPTRIRKRLWPVCPESELKDLDPTST